MTIHSPIQQLRASHRLLLKLIRQHTPSRAELSQLSGLTPGAITQYCDQLFELGLIKNGDKIEGKRGTASYYLTLNPAACYALGITFSVDVFYLAIVDFSGKCVYSHTVPYQSENDFEATIAQVKQSIYSTLTAQGIAEAQVIGVGYAIPGYIQDDGSYSAAWLPMMQQGPNLQAVFEAEIGLKAWVENNINAITIGEYYSGLWNQIEDMVVISADFGVGAGIISQGQLVAGGFGNAGEIGMFFPQQRNRPSWRDLLLQLQQHGFSEADLPQLLRQRPPLLESWLTQAKQQLLFLVTSATAWLDPKVIVITGLLPAEIVSEIIEYIRHADSFTAYPNKPHPLLSSSRLEKEQTAIGTALLPIYHLFND
ncbi:sugar kinase [Mannheimia granulomatis]|uniref:Sugar kinase n=1 Tax=Mannheimia granulomatis TaxID=85402 RepID=A0A6G8JHJ0_9PAST|nr:ROK family protein [Mannheimia granulomatis]QIM66318.1 sugar kinase [Mannheimia granulomatis]